MGPTDIKVVYTDLDGTLLGSGGSLFRNHAGDFTLAGALALEMLGSRGVELALVSGRSARLLGENARMLGADHFIAEAGCVIVRGGGEVEQNCAPFGNQPGVSVFDEIAATGAPGLLFRHFKGAIQYHEPWHADHDYSHLLRGLVSTAEANAFMASNGIEGLRLVDNGAIEDRGYGMGLEEVHAYHIIPEVAGKASAIELDLRLTGRSREAAIACGDSAQDLEMAAQVRTLYMMANTRLENEVEGEPGGPEKGPGGHNNVEVMEKPMVEGFLEAMSRALGA